MTNQLGQVPGTDYETFTQLYPDVHPAEHIPLRTGEKCAVVASSAVLAFGGAAGQLLVAGVGILALLGSLYLIGSYTPRRIRNEARGRFPQQDWYENYAEDQLPLRWGIPLIWLAITGICAACLFLVPQAYTLTAATVCGLVAAVALWFAPGLYSGWRVSMESNPSNMAEL